MMSLNKNNLDDKKNILVFFCDQLRIDLLNCYRDTIVKTPNIDKLSEEALVFDKAYTPTAICSPARTSLMTGLYPHKHHIFNNTTPGYSYCEHLREDVTMIQDWVDEEQEYETAYFGKWHIGPAEDLFNSNFHYTHPRPYKGGPPFLSSSHWHPNNKLGTITKSMLDGKAGVLDTNFDEFPDVKAAKYVQEFITKRKKDRPFLTFCAFPGPHSPWFLPENFGLRYNPADIPLWENRKDSLKGKPINQKKLRIHEEIKESSFALNDNKIREALACLFSYMELIDKLVGDVIDTLKKENIYDDTVIVFTADHGDMVGSHGFSSKGAYMYDEIYRIPMIIRHPTYSRKGFINEPVNLMDLTATLLHIMSGKEQEKMGNNELHGNTLLPFFQNSSTNHWDRDYHYGEYHGDWYGHYSSRMITDGNWKLIWNLTDLCELYDLKNDPGEIDNLFYEEEYKDIREELFEELKNMANYYNDGHITHVNKFDAEKEDKIKSYLKKLD